jgi:hypothetical protein
MARVIEAALDAAAGVVRQTTNGFRHCRTRETEEQTKRDELAKALTHASTGAARPARQDRSGHSLMRERQPTW